MKTLLILFSLIIVSFVNAQQTYVPDDNFEAYLETNSMGNGIPNDDYVTTSNIDGITVLFLLGASISDLTGIEDFVSLDKFACMGNLLSSIDLTANVNLTELNCSANQLTTLDLSQNTALTIVFCNSNLLTSLDVSQNITLDYLDCGMNSLTSLNLSENTNLTGINCQVNQLTYLNVANGNNTAFSTMYTINNPNLSCIEVDDVAYSEANWAFIDAGASFNLICDGAVGLVELATPVAEILKITDLTGRETKFVPNTLLIYIYRDGTTERIFRLEQ